VLQAQMPPDNMDLPTLLMKVIVLPLLPPPLLPM
jgi:hypothetical protein